jgi:hypothetical protein
MRFKFIVPINAFMNVAAQMPAEQKEIMGRTVEQGQHWSDNYKKILYFFWNRDEIRGDYF